MTKAAPSRLRSPGRFPRAPTAPKGGETHLRGPGLGPERCLPRGWCRRSCGCPGRPGPANLAGQAIRRPAPAICTLGSPRTATSALAGCTAHDGHFRFLRSASRSLGRCSSLAGRDWPGRPPLTGRGQAAGDAAAELSRGRPRGGRCRSRPGEYPRGSAGRVRKPGPRSDRRSPAAAPASALSARSWRAGRAAVRPGKAAGCARGFRARVLGWQHLSSACSVRAPRGGRGKQGANAPRRRC